MRENLIDYLIIILIIAVLLPQNPLDIAIKMSNAYLLFILIIALLINFLVLYEIQNVINSTKWPSTEGVIVSSKIKRRWRSYGSSGDESFAVPSYQAHLIISYSVDHNEYKTKKKSVVNRRSGWLSSRYGQEEPLNVYYDPKNPKKSVLVPEIRWVYLAIPIIMLLLFFVSVFGILMIGVSLVIPLMFRRAFVRGCYFSIFWNEYNTAWLKRPSTPQEQLDNGSREVVTDELS
ncbi:MAG: DUF3592 domain-containing protein [Candidatus Hodarchaeales archaeon]|jgi:hypothetical protein